MFSLLFFGIAVISTVTANDAQLPNILILYADDLGYGDLKSYNPNSKIQTPNLDKLANEGLVLTDAHSSAGTCSPSRYALQTGRYHWRKQSNIIEARDPSMFDNQIMTLPKMLKSKGYDTAYIGKFHMGGVRYNEGSWTAVNPIGSAIDIGYDYFFSENVINFPPYAWIENKTFWPGGTVLGRNYVGGLPTDRFTDKTPLLEREGNMHRRPGPMVPNWDFYRVEELLVKKSVLYVQSRQNTGKPWFLCYNSPHPHFPILPRREFWDVVGGGPYGEATYQMDDGMGQILTAIDNIGQTDNTLVIFSSDNGVENHWKDGYKRRLAQNHWSSSPLRGWKRDLTEGGHRVATIIKYPGKIAPGRSSSLFSQIDIFATVAQIVRYRYPNANVAEDSISQYEVWFNDRNAKPRTSLVYNTFDNEYAYRQNEMVFIDKNIGTRYSEGHCPSDYKRRWPQDCIWDPNNNGQLFNLTADLSQRNNLITNAASVPQSMKSTLNQIRNSQRTAPVYDFTIEPTPQPTPPITVPTLKPTPQPVAKPTPPPIQQPTPPPVPTPTLISIPTGPPVPTTTTTEPPVPTTPLETNSPSTADVLTEGIPMELLIALIVLLSIVMLCCVGGLVLYLR